MPIKSYIAYPKPGKGKDLTIRLQSLSECEVLPSVDHNLLILVTDTKDEPSEIRLQQSLESLEDLDCLAMVFGHIDTNVGQEE
jgi:nitrate reductase NapAB chaperone NapD